MKKLLRSILLTLSLFSMLSSYAQNFTIKGRVIDEKKETAIGANIIVVGTSIGTITDYNGNFSISVPKKNSILRISYIGYQVVEVSASSPQLASGIILKEDAQLLSDVVVIGYGKVKKSDSTGSIQSIKPDELNKGSQISSLQKKVHGERNIVNLKRVIHIRTD